MTVIREDFMGYRQAQTASENSCCQGLHGVKTAEGKVMPLGKAMGCRQSEIAQVNWVATRLIETYKEIHLDKTDSVREVKCLDVEFIGQHSHGTVWQLGASIQSPFEYGVRDIEKSSRVRKATVDMMDSSASF